MVDLHVLCVCIDVYSLLSHTHIRAQVCMYSLSRCRTFSCQVHTAHTLSTPPNPPSITSPSLTHHHPIPSPHPSPHPTPHTALRKKTNIPEDQESQQDFERYTAIKEDAAITREEAAASSGGGGGIIGDKEVGGDVKSSTMSSSLKSEGVWVVGSGCVGGGCVGGGCVGGGCNVVLLHGPLSFPCFPLLISPHLVFPLHFLMTHSPFISLFPHSPFISSLTGSVGSTKKSGLKSYISKATSVIPKVKVPGLTKRKANASKYLVCLCVILCMCLGCVCVLLCMCWVVYVSSYVYWCVCFVLCCRDCMYCAGCIYCYCNVMVIVMAWYVCIYCACIYCLYVNPAHPHPNPIPKTHRHTTSVPTHPPTHPPTPTGPG